MSFFQGEVYTGFLISVEVNFIIYIIIMFLYNKEKVSRFDVKARNDKRLVIR